MSQTDILIRAVNSANCLAAVALINIGGPHKRAEENLLPEKNESVELFGSEIESLYVGTGY